MLLDEDAVATEIRVHVINVQKSLGRGDHQAQHPVDPDGKRETEPLKRYGTIFEKINAELKPSRWNRQ